MESSARSLIASPDDTLLRSAERSLASLGLTTLLAKSVAEAQHALARVRVEILCLDSVLPIDELERFWRWLRSDGSRPVPGLIMLAPTPDRATSGALPAFFRPRRDVLVTTPLDVDKLTHEASRLLAARPKPKAQLLRGGSLALDVEHRLLICADGTSITVTPIELRLLRCLIERSGEFVSPEELIEYVWNFAPGTGGPELVRAHMSNLRRKLRMAGQDPQLVLTAPYRGYGIGIKEGNGRR